MKKGLFYLIGMVMVLSRTMAQEMEKKDTLPPFEFQRQMYIYSLASKYNDHQTAKTALYNILSLTPGNTTVMDSLAVLYYQLQEYVPAALMCQDILSLNPSDMLAAEIGAVSFESLGVPGKAIPLYEKLYLNNNDINILYQITSLQINEKRYEEALVNIDAILQNNESNNIQLLFTLKDGRNMQAPMKAAAYRLLGLLEADRGNTESALAAYDKALEITPIFESVKDLKADLTSQ
jgi:tetratricopeptide (TPR) repeat protein